MVKKKFKNEYWSLKAISEAENYTISSLPCSENFVLTDSKSYLYNDNSCKIGLYKMHKTPDPKGVTHVKQLQQITLQAKPIVASAMLSANNHTHSHIGETSHCVVATGHNDGRVNIFEIELPEVNDELPTLRNGTKIVRHYNQGKLSKSSTMRKNPPHIDQVLNWDISNFGQNLITVVGNFIVINDINRKEAVYTRNFSFDTSDTESMTNDSVVRYCDVNPANLTLLGMINSSGNASLLDLRTNKSFSSKLCSGKKSLSPNYQTAGLKSEGNNFETPYHARCSWLDQYKLCTTNAKQTNMVDIWDIRYAGKYLYQLKHEDPYTSITSLKMDLSNKMFYTSDSAGNVVSWDTQKIVSSEAGTSFTTTPNTEFRPEYSPHDLNFDVFSASCGNYVISGNPNGVTQPKELSLVGAASSLITWDTNELGCHNLCDEPATDENFDYDVSAHSHTQSNRAESIVSSSFSDNSILSSVVFSSASDVELPSPTSKNIA